jgi:hypothetical protein
VSPASPAPWTTSPAPGTDARPGEIAAQVTARRHAHENTKTSVAASLPRDKINLPLASDGDRARGPAPPARTHRPGESGTAAGHGCRRRAGQERRVRGGRARGQPADPIARARPPASVGRRSGAGSCPPARTHRPGTSGTAAGHGHRRRAGPDGRESSLRRVRGGRGCGAAVQARARSHHRLVFSHLQQILKSGVQHARGLFFRLGPSDRMEQAFSILD